ncbi:MAG: peptidylprolyl isomerase [Brumimicrobium sp.]
MKFLVSILIIVIGFVTFAQKDDPIVMKVDNQPVKKSEFLRVYMKNNNNPQYDKASLDEYVNLYKNFRLKVKAAEDLKYDTIPGLVRELRGYKQQLAKPYLVDKEKTEELEKEAYDRLSKEVRASHILLKVDKEATPQDTLAIYKKAIAIKKRIESGEDFETVAVETSEDPSVTSNKGDLGYFTAFQMVYPFESIAYNTPVGKVSAPVRTSYGYHIVKVQDIRPARGKITTAHIMIVPGVNDKEKKDFSQAKKKIDEIYEKLLNGENFEDLVRLYSDDMNSKQNNGQLPPFGTGANQRMVPEFEEAAFKLKNDGDFSEPVETAYGYHIIKRLSYEPFGTFEELKPMIQQKIKQGDRSTQSTKSFINKLKDENKFNDKNEKSLKWFYENIDSTFFDSDWNKPKVPKKVMFKYNKQKFYAPEFMDFLIKRKSPVKSNVREMIHKSYHDWLENKIIEDEKSQLETKYPDYKALVQEYHDGILLYEIMKDKVWDKAVRDTVGLQKYFSENIDNYQWPDRIQGIIFSSPIKEKVIEAGILANVDTLELHDIMKVVNADSELNLNAQKGKFIQSDRDELKGRTFYKGNNEVFEFDGKFYMVRVEEFLPAGPKELNETRGAVIQNYQDYLEKNWLKELNEKYSVEINKEVLYSIGD